MGFVDDESDSEAEENTMFSEVDEESDVTAGKESPLLRHSFAHSAASPNDPRTPTTKNNDLLSVTRLRRKGITESEEIWEELEDDTVSEYATPYSRRISIAQFTRSPRHAPEGALAEDAPNETTALLSRSGTGRSYRDKGRRRSSHLTNSRELDRRRKSVSSQEAQGGWWKMKRWFKGPDRKDKDHDDENDNMNGNGAGS